jgi:hypothetical protein
MVGVPIKHAMTTATQKYPARVNICTPSWVEGSFSKSSIHEFLCDGTDRSQFDDDPPNNVARPQEIEGFVDLIEADNFDRVTNLALLLQAP